MHAIRIASVAAVLAAGLLATAGLAAAEGGYCVVVAEATHAEPAWQAVVAALVAKHQATTLVYRQSIEESLAGLVRERPKLYNFLLIPNPGRCDPARAYHVVFRASRADGGK
jgi:hypothetical protein